MAAEDGRGEKEGADAAAARKAKRQGGFSGPCPSSWVSDSCSLLQLLLLHMIWSVLA